MNRGGLGSWLEAQRARTTFWLLLLLLVLGLLTILNVWIRPDAAVSHAPQSTTSVAPEGEAAAPTFWDSLFLIDAPHFVYDDCPGFWQVFGLVCAVAMAFVLKRIIAPVLSQPEDCYDRDD